MFMIADRDWKLIHFETGDRPMLFDLNNDPHELVDLGNDPTKQNVIDALYHKLFQWARRPAARTTISNEALRRKRGRSAGTGVLIGVVDEDSIDPELTEKYRGRKAPDKRA